MMEGLMSVGGVMAAAGVLAFWASDDEVPIYVKNGSMQILPGTDPENTWNWTHEPGGDNQEKSPSYSHEPGDKFRDRGRTLWVKVHLQNNTTWDARGNNVFVEYENGKFTARFKRGRSGWWDYRTKARPASDLTLQGNVLRYAGQGYITGVKVDGKSFTVPSREALRAVAICSREITEEPGDAR